MLQHHWWSLQAQARHEEIQREAQAVRLAAAGGRNLGLRQWLGRVLLRLGAALVEPPMPRRVNEE